MTIETVGALISQFVHGSYIVEYKWQLYFLSTFMLPVQFKNYCTGETKAYIQPSVVVDKVM
jgi:hypothetical protein